MDLVRLKAEVEAGREELIALRRTLHANPELGFNEFETAKIIVDTLRGFGCDDIREGVAGTGVLATIRGGQPGQIVMFRADIDAVPNCQDLKEVPYKSKNPGLCHSCGHDVHIAVALGVAKVLCENRERLKGTAKIFFQASEEQPRKIDPTLQYDIYTEPSVGHRGAYLASLEGVLENPVPDRLLGMHCWPTLEAGKIGYQYGPTMAGSGNFHLSILGKRGHAAAPHKSVDAIVTAGQVIAALQTLVSRRADPTLPLVCTIGAIRGGTRRSTITDLVDMTGTVRAFDTKFMAEEVPHILHEIIGGVCQSAGAGYMLDYGVDQPPLINSDEVVRECAAFLGKAMGENMVELHEAPMTSEDFPFLAKNIPSIYMKLGTCNADPATQYPLHNSLFDVDEKCLVTGVYGVAGMMLNYLGVM